MIRVGAASTGGPATQPFDSDDDLTVTRCAFCRRRLSEPIECRDAQDFDYWSERALCGRKACDWEAMQ